MSALQRLPSSHGYDWAWAPLTGVLFSRASATTRRRHGRWHCDGPYAELYATRGEAAEAARGYRETDRGERA